MQLAVMLYFDDETNKLANDYIQKMKDISNNDYMLENNMPAHITLAMWNSEYNYYNELEELAASHESFDVKFTSIGFFNDTERHIFFSPLKNKKLLALHADIYDTVKLEDESEYIQMYKDKNIWVPHATIGYQVEKEHFKNALGICAEIKLPVLAKAKKIALASCCPYTELAVFDLG